LMSLFKEEQIKKPIINRCILCGREFKFGEKCDCMVTYERINALHEKVMNLLKVRREEKQNGSTSISDRRVCKW